MKKALIKILNRAKILGAFNLIFITTINGTKFRIPLINQLGFENIDISEPWMIQLLEITLSDRKDRAYVDVGVNIGQTLIKVKSVNPDIKYYGFEPNPTCIYYVKELIKINRFKNATIFPVGISDETGVYELSFFSDDDADSAASIVRDFRPTQKVFQKEFIACFNISDIISKYDMPSIGILKIDVEGAEKEVIEGFRKRILTDQPIIQLEILPIYNEKNRDRLSRQEALENFFNEINYSILRIHRDRSNGLAGLEEIKTIGIHSNLDWCEYIIVPANIKDSVTSMA